MDVDFKKKQLRPGDDGFEYDKRVEFNQALSGNGSWDEDIVSNEDDDYFDDDFA